MISVGKCAKADQSAYSNSTHSQGNSTPWNKVRQCKLHWITNPLNRISFMFSLADNHQPSSRQLKKDNQVDKAESSSPRTVLDALEGQSNSTEYDTFSTRVSSITDTPSMASKNKSQSKLRKSQSPFRLIASFLGSPFRRKTEKPQPLLKCFSYEQISNATNDFHQGI